MISSVEVCWGKGGGGQGIAFKRYCIDYNVTVSDCG